MFEPAASLVVDEGKRRELESLLQDTTLKKTRPAQAIHWSARVLAAKLGVSRMMVQRGWQRYNVQPHHVEKFKISNDPKCEDNVRDVVGLYLDPPDRALAFCVDEKSQIPALDRTALILPLRPGLPERQTHDYKRYGTSTLFAAFKILNGKVNGCCVAASSWQGVHQIPGQAGKAAASGTGYPSHSRQLLHPQERRCPALAEAALSGLHRKAPGSAGDIYSLRLEGHS